MNDNLQVTCAPYLEAGGWFVPTLMRDKKKNEKQYGKGKMLLE